MQTTNPINTNMLIELHYQTLFRFAARLCGSPETALSLTQRTLRKAVDRSRSLPIPARVRQWLFTLLFSEFLQTRRRACRAARQ